MQIYRYSTYSSYRSAMVMPVLFKRASHNNQFWVRGIFHISMYSGNIHSFVVSKKNWMVENQNISDKTNPIGVYGVLWLKSEWETGMGLNSECDKLMN